MKIISFLFIFLVELTASAAPDNSLYEGPAQLEFKKKNDTYTTCTSSTEFKKSVEFLSKETDLQLSETAIIEKSFEIAKGCTGASERFSELFSLLKKSGVDLGESFKLAILFSKLESERALAFKEIFKKTFLESYLNLDFKNAFDLSLALSKDYNGKPENIKNDFVQLTQFCLDEKQMALDFTSCKNLIVSVTASTEMYPKGVYDDFRKVYDYLKTNKRLGLSIQSSLQIIPGILRNGPKSVQNFISSFDYAINESPIKLNEQQALKLAIALSDQSAKKVEKPKSVQ